MAKTERKFKYQRRDTEAVRERANMKAGDFDSILKSSIKVYKPREGKNLIRILPPTWDNARHYGYDLWINYGIGVDNQSYLSISKMRNERDPIEEARRAADRDEDKELSKSLTPRRRIAMWVIDRMAEDEGPQFWSSPFSFDKDLANLCFDEDTREATMIDDPESGCDVRFHKEGTGLKTTYDASKMRLMKPSPLHEDERIQEEWLEFVTNHPVPDCLQFYDYDHIAKVFNGQTPAKRDKDEDEDAPPPRRRVAEVKQPAPFDEDEDEAEPAPVRQRAAPSKTVEESGEESSEEDVEVSASSIRDRIRARRLGNAQPDADDIDEEVAPRRRSRV